MSYKSANLDPLKVSICEWENQPDNKERCSRQWYAARGKECCTCNECVQERTITVRQITSLGEGQAHKSALHAERTQGGE
jgi:hypothetical protein